MHLLRDDFQQQFSDLAKAIATTPGAQKNLLRHEVAFATHHFDLPTRALGIPTTSEDIITITTAEAVTYEQMKEFTEDPELVKIIAALFTEIGMAKDTFGFSADVMVTIDKRPRCSGKSGKDV
ncbi:hypothetical protein B0H10DRAFT_1952322 [Mycena sp. CBHHK59/15]|nr:hypothetical protein B0H10DRAFT_1952322 [Mycena sp. CBHHK59/15]